MWQRAGGLLGLFYEGAEPIPRFDHWHPNTISRMGGTSKGFCRPRGTRGHHVALTAQTLMLWEDCLEDSLGHTNAIFDASYPSNPPGSAPDEAHWGAEHLV